MSGAQWSTASNTAIQRDLTLNRLPQYVNHLCFLFHRTACHVRKKRGEAKKECKRFAVLEFLYTPASKQIFVQSTSPPTLVHNLSHAVHTWWGGRRHNCHGNHKECMYGCNTPSESGRSLTLHWANGSSTLYEMSSALRRFLAAPYEHIISDAVISNVIHATTYKHINIAMWFDVASFSILLYCLFSDVLCLYIPELLHWEMLWTKNRGNCESQCLLWRCCKSRSRTETLCLWALPFFPPSSQLLVVGSRIQPHTLAVILQIRDMDADTKLRQKKHP